MRTLLVVMVLLLLVPGIVLASRDSSPAARSDSPKAGAVTPAAEQLRTERRESFQHKGCSKGKERLSDSSV